jgi:hypothetical protein
LQTCVVVELGTQIFIGAFGIEEWVVLLRLIWSNYTLGYFSIIVFDDLFGDSFLLEAKFVEISCSGVDEHKFAGDV